MAICRTALIAPMDNLAYVGLALFALTNEANAGDRPGQRGTFRD